MRKIIIVIALVMSLMSTKCAEKRVNIVIDNTSDRNVVFSFTKNTDSLKNVISGKFYHDNRFKYLKKNSIKTDTLGESDLYFYFTKERDFYTFYFLRPIKFDTLTNNYVFEKKYDSINLKKEKILIGDEANNTFIYTNRKIVFKSRMK